MLSNPFFLEMLFRHKRDAYLRETVRDRLLREAREGARRQGAAGRTKDPREKRTAALYRKLVSGLKLMIAETLHPKHAATAAHSSPVRAGRPRAGGTPGSDGRGTREGCRDGRRPSGSCG